MLVRRASLSTSRVESLPLASSSSLIVGCVSKGTSLILCMYTGVAVAFLFPGNAKRWPTHCFLPLGPRVHHGGAPLATSSRRRSRCTRTSRKKNLIGFHAGWVVSFHVYFYYITSFHRSHVPTPFVFLPRCLGARAGLGCARSRSEHANRIVRSYESRGSVTAVPL